ncbi:MAG: biotin--[acetyl-CoA-carboxylase] ligase [Candidatus Omnitrophota bacterium]|jgi:BirA family biotin operon repressor/biotin-[acetyl-CoA-carboxylase] ligase
MIHFDIRHYPEISSTNAIARDEAGRGAPEGLVITADYQTEGRGKPGRKWESPSGKNLLFSVLLRPALEAAKIPILTQIACRSVAAVLEHDYGLRPVFKRPNDVLIDGKKICGILTEASSAGARVDYVVIGIGLNVNAGGETIFPGATSLKMETGRETDRAILLRQILEQLGKDLRS